MKQLNVVRSLFVFLMVALTSHLCTGLSTAQTKLVFAHYMMSNRNYGDYLGAGLVTAYEHDIQDAKDYGVDGFALNIGAWENNYIIDTAAMFEAAENVDPDFKLFISADMSNDLSADDIVDIMNIYADHPNYFYHDSRPVLSTIGGGQKGGGGTGARDWWQNNVLDVLASNGDAPYFVPFFYTSAGGETPNFSQVEDDYDLWWNEVVDGMYYFGASGLPSYNAPSLLTSGEAFASVLHGDNKTYMATVSPQYWGSKQAGRRYYEYEGGKGLRAQWMSIIQNQQSEWVELTTWNDFDESSHFTPIDDVNYWWPHTAHTSPGFYRDRTGIGALNKYFIDWYKNYAPNQAPPPPDYLDNVYWMYRTHSMTAEAEDEEHQIESVDGPLNDYIYITTILIGNDATLTVNSGGVITTRTAHAGITTFNDIPFSPGTQTFTLTRGGVTICSGTGQPIIPNNQVTEYNYNYTSGHIQG